MHFCITAGSGNRKQSQSSMNACFKAGAPLNNLSSSWQKKSELETQRSTQWSMRTLLPELKIASAVRKSISQPETPGRAISGQPLQICERQGQMPFPEG